jgi:hypothetical protein
MIIYYLTNWDTKFWPGYWPAYEYFIEGNFVPKMLKGSTKTPNEGYISGLWFVQQDNKVVANHTVAKTEIVPLPKNAYLENGLCEYLITALFNVNEIED